LNHNTLYCIEEHRENVAAITGKIELRRSVDHETLVVDCQIRHFPLDLAIQREQIVIY
jgi:hypothetical protein